MPFSKESPQSRTVGSLTVPVVAIDDVTGNIWVGGVNKSVTWSPNGGSGLTLEQPQPTADPQVFTLSKTPSLLLLFMGGVLQLSGAGNDFTLNGNQITMVNAPGQGSNLQAVIG